MSPYFLSLLLRRLLLRPGALLDSGAGKEPLARKGSPTVEVQRSREDGRVEVATARQRPLGELQQRRKAGLDVGTAPRGDRRIVRRRDRQQDARRHRHAWNSGGRAHLRLHRRGDDRPADHDHHPARPAGRRAADPGAAPRRRAHRSLRDDSAGARTAADRRLGDDLADPGCNRQAHRRVEGRARHHSATTNRSAS